MKKLVLILFILWVLLIRLAFGVDAPFEDFMPNWLAEIAYLVNSIMDNLTNFVVLILTGDFNAPLFGSHEDNPLLMPIYYLHQEVL